MNDNEKYNERLEESTATAEEPVLNTKSVEVYNPEAFHAGFDKDDEVAEWAEELAVEYPENLPSLEPVETRPIIPNFSSGFRGYNKAEVDAFIDELIGYYQDRLKKADISTVTKLEDEIASLKKENKSLKNGKSISNVDAEAEKVIQSAHDLAKKILARAEKDAKKLIEKAEKEKERLSALSAKEHDKQIAKFQQIVLKAEKKATDMIEKAQRKAYAIEMKQQAVIDEANKTIAEYREKNERLVAFYATQIKALKKENKNIKH